MIVHSAFVPPRGVLEELSDAVRSIPRVEEVELKPRRRLVPRRHDQTAVPTGPAFDDIPISDLRLSIAGFGNVTTGDARRIVERLTAVASQWPTPVVFFSGATTVDFSTDRCVWAKLHGDIDALTSIARSVTQSVEGLGFFVDRRRFHPLLSLAYGTAAATDADLANIVDALERFRGQDWVVDSLVLTTQVFDGAHAESREFARIPLG